MALPRKLIFFLLALLVASHPAGLASQDDEFLDVDEAFTYTVSQRPGTLVVDFTIAPGYYLYRDRMSVTDSLEQEMPLDFSPAEQKYDPNFDEVMAVFHEAARMEADISGTGGVLVLEYQGCADDGLCYPPQKREIDVGGAPSPASGGGAAEAAGSSGLSIGAALLMAFLGGMVLNLMPCVFPVLTLKAVGLANAAAEGRSEARKQGLAYSAGVIASFVTVAAVLLVLRHGGAAVGWGFQMQSPVIVAALILLFFTMGLSLSGVADFGGRIMGVGEGLRSQTGLTGAFFTGVLTTVVASPCTAPFMGAALGFALLQTDLVALTIFVALGAGLAFPMLALSYVPSIGERMPKPGPWMETVKKISAFPLYLTCVWLVWVLTNQEGTNIMALVLIGLVLLAAGLWQYGRRQAVEGLNIPAIALVVLALGVTFAPLTVTPTLAAVPSAEKQENAFSRERLSSLLEEGEPVFVNLTADWCITCMVNHQVALDREAVRSEFERQGIVYLVGDWTNEDAEISDFLADNGRSGVPLYLYYPAGSATPKVLPQILSEDIVLDALSAGQQDAGPGDEMALRDAT